MTFSDSIQFVVAIFTFCGILTALKISTKEIKNSNKQAPFDKRLEVFMMTEEDKNQDFIKIVYFDEAAASDYVTIKNGGKMDLLEKKNDNTAKEISAEASVSVGTGFRFLNYAKAAFTGEIKASTDVNSSKVIENIFSNALLTDYISLASSDEKVLKYSGQYLSVPENSLTMYKMYSGFVDLIAPEQFKEYGVNIDKLNDVVLGTHGYYELLFNKVDNPQLILRFNVSAFKNNYDLSDLLKMNLNYFGVKVGQCSREALDIANAFNFDYVQKNHVRSAKEIVTGKDAIVKREQLDIYDVVLAGVKYD